MKLQGMITMAQGSGGQDSAELMREVFGRYFSNEVLDRMEDGAALPAPDDDEPGKGLIVVSTDSFVVTPVEFAGGDIGKLSICGTVNDILMMGAVPRYLTCGFILEEGLSIENLDRVVASMARTAEAAGITIVAGDTKVIERSAAQTDDRQSGLMINTTGIGYQRDFGSDIAPSAANASVGDVVIVNGNLGDHHACILSARMGIKNGIKSDCAVLAPAVDALYCADICPHVMRDVTRGGLGTVLNEIAASSMVNIELIEKSIPVDPEVAAFCGIMGLDPIYMGNEGKFIVIVPADKADEALSVLRATDVGKNALIIGEVKAAEESPTVFMKTKVGGTRRIDMLYGEGLPRIC